MELTRLLKFHCNQCGQKREYKEGQAQLCQKFPKGATSVYTLKVMLYKIAQMKQNILVTFIEKMRWQELSK